MCVGDWRLGRLIRSVGTSYNLAAAATFTVKPSLQRVGFLIHDVNAGTLTFPDGQQMQFGSFANWVDLSILRHGDLVTKQIIITAGGSGLGQGFTEFFMPEDYLTAALEAFKHEYKQYLH